MCPQKWREQRKTYRQAKGEKIAKPKKTDVRKPTGKKFESIIGRHREANHEKLLEKQRIKKSTGRDIETIERDIEKPTGRITESIERDIEKQTESL